MDKFLSTFELLESTGLNWSVNKLPLRGPDGQSTDSYGLFRNDNNQWLGTVGPRYTVMQNASLAETIIDACEGIGLEAKRGGQLRGGRKVYLQAELPDEYIGKSAVKRYITALNSHDGTTAISFGSTNTVVICENTFHLAYKSGDMTRFLHTANAKTLIDEAMKEMRVAMKNEQKLVDNYKRMADTKLSEEIMRAVLGGIATKAWDVGVDEKLSPRKEATLVKVKDCVMQEINDEGYTLWGIFNGITRYTNHVAAPKQDKLSYVMTGAGYDINGVAYDTIMQWIDAHSVKQYQVS